MSRRARPKTVARRRWWLAGGAVVLLAGAVWVTVQALRPQPPSGELPGPGSDPTIAQDVNTMLGQKAPALSLPDAAGKTHTITPGQGRLLVVISHMGFY